jgi:hypothetical protein
VLSLIRAGEGKPLELHVGETATLAEVFRLTLPDGVTAFGVTPDGKRLVLAHNDATLTVHPWDWTTFEPAGGAKMPVTADAIWDRLAHPDPKVGLAAVRALTADPKAALPLLAERLRPADPARVATLIEPLASDEFTGRERA